MFSFCHEMGQYVEKILASTGLSYNLLMFYVGALLILAVFCMSLALYLTSSPFPRVVRYDNELHFLDPNSGEFKAFPNYYDPPTGQVLSMHQIDNPCQNFHLLAVPPMLDECLDYLEGRQKGDSKFSYEVIVVDDGSRDRTTDVGLKYSRKMGTNKVRVLTLVKNRGKGGAVTLGMMSSRGKFLLFADADGATLFKDIEKLEASAKKLISLVPVEEEMGNSSTGATEQKKNKEGEQASNDINWERPAVIVGSRAHMESESIAKRSYIRTLLMLGFHLLVRLFGVKGIRDTQCGFKLFTRQAARLCFSNLHVQKWAFDVELLKIAYYFNMRMEEVAVTWTEIEGSKVIPVWSWVQMGKDLMVIWFRYKAGIWRITPKIN
ncbi:unnamed protein product [Darwinula stevensoni]|uniref:dolichyl-phosphate beta-glucosyltransferase n=1 Tax=Darwinula stevensoni TaxID=69355 RepID=A0A7R9A5W0_9CRUS|nr:unnamed protein product [Darwinula stevensoni]CAG0887319.1 unnamed protein product [Darwinula stevensoni]